jgi:hypothetical protein
VIEYLVDRWGEAVKSADSDGDLPLHIACEEKAPLKVVRFLVEQWSEAIKTANHNGCLPLHHACSSTVPFDVVEFLVKEWPEAIKIMDGEQSSAVGAACHCCECPVSGKGMLTKWFSSTWRSDRWSNLWSY